MGLLGITDMYRQPARSHTESSLWGRVWGVLAVALTGQRSLIMRAPSYFQASLVGGPVTRAPPLQQAPCSGENQLSQASASWPGLPQVGDRVGKMALAPWWKIKRHAEWALITGGLRCSWRYNEHRQSSVASSSILQEQSEPALMRLIQQQRFTSEDSGWKTGLEGVGCFFGWQGPLLKCQEMAYFKSLPFYHMWD